MSRSTYKTPPYSRAQLERLRVLSCSSSEHSRLDSIERAFDAEDREKVAALEFMRRVREICRITIAQLEGKP